MMSSQPQAEPACSPDWTATLSDRTRQARGPLLIRGAGPCGLAAVRGRAGLGVCAVSTGSLTAGDGGTEPLCVQLWALTCERGQDRDPWDRAARATLGRKPTACPRQSEKPETLSPEKIKSERTC